MMKLMTGLIHETRNQPQRVRFSADRIIIDLADGRFVSAPLRFFPALQAADDSQRQDYLVQGLCLRWEGLNESIDLNAMLTGLYAAMPETGDGIEGHSAT